MVKRAKTSLLNSLMTLTREADAALQWRIAGWLSVVLMPFLAGAMLGNVSHVSAQFISLPVVPEVIFLVLAIAALLLSFLRRSVLVVLSIVAVLGSFISSYLFGYTAIHWQMTDVVFSEWGGATVLALIASGVGLGIYAQTNIQQASQIERSSHLVLPVWFAQLLAVVAFGFFSIHAQVSALVFLITVVFGAALLLQLARQQLADRQMSIVIQHAVILAAFLVWLIPHTQTAFNLVLMLWGLLSCLAYTIFAGWIMKISHLRKVLNFSSELYYNIWRIAVRIVAPLSIIVAIVAVIYGRI